ncbi:MAG: DEAD/DEAH box helicase [Spirochaetales bacterium]|nr:DEAD/DEAH box helicase [Spirochaetales bacterium]MBQ2258677.1 DEAD/DEAH box helicase [Spirochaetales bacterium]
MELLPAFASLGLTAKTLEALHKKGFEEPTEIQSACIPLLLKEGTEVVGQAQTGTGKTAAFALPIIETVDEYSKNVQALILAPTRELALQVSEEINSIKGERRIEIAPIYGGASMENQLRKLKKGVQIVVGTPGRILDHIRRGSLKLDDLEFMVLDEADEMLDMGFIEDIEEVLKAVPEEKRMLMFSATMPPEILKLAETFMKNPQIVRTQSKDMATTAADQIYYEVREADKLEALTRIIDRDPDFYGVVFCRTKLQCDEVSKKLVDRGYDAAALHGDLTQREREHILQRVKAKSIVILVATDVAARGLDIKDLTHVINYSLPQDPEIYIHRVGRTGRAGRTGTAITFITPSEARRFTFIKKASRSEIRKEEIPTADEVIASKRNRIKQELDEALSKEAPHDYYNLAEDILDENDPREAIASLLAFIYKDELDVKQYKDIRVISRTKERKEARKIADTNRPFDRIKTPDMDEKGQTRLFIARGRKDGLTKRYLVDIIMAHSGARNEEINDVEVMEEFSFINAPYDVAERILRAFEKRNNGKPLVTKAKPESSPRNKKVPQYQAKKESFFESPKASKKARKGNDWKKREEEEYSIDYLRREEDDWDRPKKKSSRSSSSSRSGSKKKASKPAKSKKKGRR